MTDWLEPPNDPPNDFSTGKAVFRCGMRIRTDDDMSFLVIKSDPKCNRLWLSGLPYGDRGREIRIEGVLFRSEFVGRRGNRIMILRGAPCKLEGDNPIRVRDGMSEDILKCEQDPRGFDDAAAEEVVDRTMFSLRKGAR